MSRFAGLFMSTRDFERRRPRVTVQDLRRDLRHADEQLFALIVPERPEPARVRPRRGPIALALVGLVPLAFGAWASFAGDRPRETAAVRVDVTPIAATVVPDPVPGALVADDQPAPSERRLPPPRRAAATRRAVDAASQTIATTAVPQKTAWEPPRRHVPRPLSPGEFGRR
jgi:hypothetical protein